MTQPHVTFSYTRADEVAECWEGIETPLYEALWAIAAKQRPVPNIEDSGPADHISYENLASHWSDLTSLQQVTLNRMAEDRDAEFKEMMRAAFENGGGLLND